MRYVTRGGLKSLQIVLAFKMTEKYVLCDDDNNIALKIVGHGLNIEEFPA